MIVGNRCEHPQPGFLAGLRVGPQLQLFNLTGNKFVSTEAGFLDLDPVVYETYTPDVYKFEAISNLR